MSQIRTQNYCKKVASFLKRMVKCFIFSVYLANFARNIPILVTLGTDRDAFV